jgi:hypothetical protein
LPRKVIVKGRKTHAKGEKDIIKGNRFMNTISLMSLRIEDVHEANPLDKVGEFFFEVDAEGIGAGKELRVPAAGEIRISLNKSFSARQDFMLWKEFDEADRGEKTKTIKIKVLEQDRGRNDKVLEAKVPIVYGSGTKYEVFREEGIKLKIKISSAKTKF